MAKSTPETHDDPHDEQQAEASSPPPPDVDFSHRIVRHAIPDHMLDPDAVKVVRRLSRFGYDAFLVGGCVRDILFERQPKDFDVATSALPAEVRRLFRNCRIIGRRFRLAHLLFKKGKIIEVATFRRSATEEDDISDRHAAENLFGGPADDAIRRDFTMNALMYDVGRREIHDYVGGLGDIEARALRTIGDPERRFPEDPVRIIRAVKFAVRLDLTIDPAVLAVMKRHAPLVADCAPARLAEELFKLLRSGTSAKCFDLLCEVGVLAELMPGLASRVTELSEREVAWCMLARVDEKIQEDNHVSEAAMIAALIWPFTHHLLDEPGDLAARFEEMLSALLDPMRFTKRHLSQVRQIFLAQRRLALGVGSRRSRKILDREFAADALDLLELTSSSEEDKERLAEWLKAFAARKRTYRPRRSRRRTEPQPGADDPDRPPRKRRRPRRRKKKDTQPE